MNAVPIEKKSSKRGVAVLISVILLLIFGVCGAWFYASAKLEEAIHSAQQRLLTKNLTVDCENLEIRGFPFRLGIFCDQILLKDEKQRRKLTSGAIRSAAQAYDPGKFVVEFDGPALLNDVRLGVFKSNWQSLRASGRVNLDGIEYASIIAHAISIHGKTDPTPLATSETLELHVRKLNSDDLDVAMGAGNFSLTGITSSPLQISMELTAENMFSVIQHRENLISHLEKSGGSGHLNALQLSVPDGGILEISGPLSVDTNGLVSGALEVTATKPHSLVQFFGAFIPDGAVDLDQIETAILMFSPQKAGTLSHGFKVQIQEGDIRLGLFPLGKIPRLF